MSKTTVYILTIFLSFISLTSNGQKVREGCGLDKEPTLNKCELEFFDSFFGDENLKKKNFDFREKKFAFISGGQLIDKDDFFKLVEDYRGPKGFDFFNNEQKAKTGYDGIILVNLKAYSLDNIAQIIEKEKGKYGQENQKQDYKILILAETPVFMDVDTLEGASLNESEISTLVNLSGKCMQKWNKTQPVKYKDGYRRDRKAEDYYRQYLAAYNKSGDKLVWINFIRKTDVKKLPEKIVIITDSQFYYSCWVNLNQLRIVN